MTRRTSAELIEALRADPDSKDLHESLLHAYFEEGRGGDRARFECVLWMVANDPHNRWCATPLAHFDPRSAPDLFEATKAAWLAHASRDAELLCAAAQFVAAEDREHAVSLLKRASERSPGDWKPYFDLGRISTAPIARLDAFLRAHELGSDQPNLTAWIATTAAEASDASTAERFARMLLGDVARLRERHGDALDWGGDDVWERAKRRAASKEATARLTHAIAEAAYKKHHAHTAIGVIALQRGDVAEALRQLASSADLPADYRLKAYGPNMTLVRALCAAGETAAATEFLQRWNASWPARALDDALEAITANRLP